MRARRRVKGFSQQLRGDSITHSVGIPQLRRDPGSQHRTSLKESLTHTHTHTHTHVLYITTFRFEQSLRVTT